MDYLKTSLKWLLFAVCLLSVQACAGGLAPIPDSFPEQGTVAFGRIKVMLTGPSRRWYEPEVRFIELYNDTIDKRFRIDIESDESLFAVSLPEGEYRITRVQIREGGFRGMAELTTSFHLEADTVNYLGTWTFGVGSPYYDRDLVMTVSSDMVETVVEANMIFKDLSPRPITSNLAQPTEIKSRLFEITSYPRVRWFQRRTTG